MSHPASPELLVSYESVATDSEEAGHNHSWQVMADGQVFTRRNAPNARRPISVTSPYWFERSYSDTASYTLSSEQLAALHEHLSALSQEVSSERQEAANPNSEHGGWDRLWFRGPQGPVDVELHSSQEARMRGLVRPLRDLIAKVSA